MPLLRPTCISLLVAFSACLCAQQGGTISGTVADVTGKGIPNAVVTVRNEAGGAPRMAAADADGKYSVTGLADGSYQLEAAAPSFAISRRNGVKVSAAAPVNVSMSLNVNELAQSITVE